MSSVEEDLERGLRRFNRLDDGQVQRLLLTCCSSAYFAESVGRARPFPSYQALVAAADAAVADAGEPDIDQALSGHPRIGERCEHAASQREQSGVVGADPDLLTELAAGNAAYEEKFGHVYLVFANGRPATELLALLQVRLGNDPVTERRVLRGELTRINALRLHRLMTGLAGPESAPSNPAPFAPACTKAARSDPAPSEPARPEAARSDPGPSEPAQPDLEEAP